MFHHEDFSGQLLFDPTPLQGQGASGAVLPAAAASAGGGNIQQQHQALLDEQQEIPENQSKRDCG